MTDTREIIEDATAKYLEKHGLAGEYVRDDGDTFCLDGDFDIKGLPVAILSALAEAGYVVVPMEPADVRETLERRKATMTDMLTPYVSQGKSSVRAQWQHERIGEIVEGCRKLGKSPDGRSWLPEFYGGTPISSACETAWEIHCLTKETVQFIFNGVEIKMEDPLP